MQVPIVCQFPSMCMLQLGSSAMLIPPMGMPAIEAPSSSFGPSPWRRARRERGSWRKSAMARRSYVSGGRQNR